MDVYRLKPEALATARASIVRRMGWVLLYMEAVGALAFLFLMRPAPSPALLGGLLLLLAALCAFSCWRTLEQTRAAWGSYVLELTEDAVLRRHRQVADLRLRREEVTRIVELPGQGMSLLTAQPTRYVNVPETVERYAEVRERLAQWRPIEQMKPHPMIQQVGFVLGGLLFLALWLSVGLVPDVRLAMIPGVLVLVIAIAGIVKTARAGLPRSMRVGLIGGLAMMGLAGPARLAFTLLWRLLTPEAP